MRPINRKTATNIKNHGIMAAYGEDFGLNSQFFSKKINSKITGLKKPVTSELP